MHKVLWFQEFDSQKFISSIIYQRIIQLIRLNFMFPLT